MTSAVLILNAGSSSIKFALYETERLEVLCRGAIDGIGSTPRFTPKGTTAVRLTEAPALPQPATHDNLTAWLLDMLRTRLPDVTITAAGHRVVHGGARFNDPVRVDDAVMAELDQLVSLAPLHEPHNVATIRAVTKAWGQLPQVA